MISIKNVNLITDKVSDFRFVDLRQVINLRYYLDKNEYYEDIACIDIDFIFEPKGEICKYRVTLKFNDVNSIKFDIGKFIYLSIFQIVDTKEKGWGATQRYLIHDYENKQFSFYCESVEVIGIERV